MWLRNIKNILFSYPRPIVLLALLCTSLTGHAENSIEFEWDPYYSNAGYYISLTDEPIPEIVEDDEAKTYDRLLDSAITMPRFVLLELSANPLPMLGEYIRDHHPNTYENAQLRGDLNIVQAFTEGFEEPYAVSLFFGSVMRFVKPGEKIKTKNRGYTGYLASFGDKHIVNNTYINDNWYELEWKTKGDQDFKNKTLSWSLRVGSKIHDHPDITDVIYFGLRRNHFDAASDEISWFQNADIDYKIELDNDNFELVQQNLFINKKWPAPFGAEKSAFELGVGFILGKNKYSGSLQNQSEDFRLILRPSFKF
ncbi:MAG: hypothetical protein KAS57_01810 [Gammaproteobacteria bacterium]|nr:hypothetical protein [Gammaproteobacteria bacterium]